ncbi:CtsR family transcriptional regulator [Vagococcus elongatus]|uniref:Transcriptional regulator CtsR n=1 Tax=Vagococcus elongatus TaxID=180344 RepID=A0A430AMZ3_9ENTE|nr:CtsR family transcriptional regulator [Vagococcus elongatus]RSU09287.1 CtsR family transcriptional regulator [Vagococcus elongatus]
MSHQSMSDLIEQYLKSILNETEEEIIEIRRSEMADLFSCVPSQINYVINTRFTLAQGYTVESKRGGGGYIRIQRVELNSHDEVLSYLRKSIGDQLTYKDGVAVLQQLYNYDIISKREAELLVSIISYEAIGKQNPSEDNVRAAIIRALLDRLRYEEKR